MLCVTHLLLHGIGANFPEHFRTRETANLFLALFIRLLKRLLEAVLRDALGATS